MVLVAVILSFVVLPMILPDGSRSRSAPPQPPQNTIVRDVEVILREKAAGLDLAAVTALAKSVKTAEEFEQKLNSRSDAVNNLDLNDDGVTDYINVSEFGSGNRRGFSLTTEVAPGENQEIATIEFQKEDNGVQVQTAGNPSLYGPGHYHHSHFGLSDAMLLYWLFSDRPAYRSPYTNYHPSPSFGGGWSPRTASEYSREMKQRTAGTTVSSSSTPKMAPLPSPNAAQTAAKARAILNPTQSQRSFSATPAKPQASGGFGRPAASANASSSNSSPSSHSTASPPSRSSSSPSSAPSRPSSFGGFGRSTSSSFSRSGSSSRGGK